HAITHGIGSLLSIIALVLLITFSAFDGGALMIVSVTIFGCTMLFMYVSSTIVHSLPIGKWKDIFLVLTMLLYMCSLQDLTHLLCLYKSTVALDGPYLALYGAVHLRVLSYSCFSLKNSSFYLHCSIF